MSKTSHKMFKFEHTIFNLFNKALTRKRNLYIRLDLKFPQHLKQIDEQKLFNDFLKDFRQQILRTYYKAELKDKKTNPYSEIIYAWKREKSQSEKGHYHLFIILNKQRVNSKKSTIQTAKRIWHNFFYPVSEEDKKKGIQYYSKGLISYRNEDEENGICFDQYNYLAKTEKDKGLNYPTKDFLFFLNSAIRQSLYLSKDRTSHRYDNCNNSWSNSSTAFKEEIHEPSIKDLNMMLGEGFNRKQLLALTMINDGKNVFLDGAGGTGKSRVIKEFIKLSGRKTLVVSPSASAARLVDGLTIHSAFNLPIGVLLPGQVLSPLTKDQERYLRSIDSLVIDECGRVRPDTLLHIDRRLRQLKDKSKSFGGTQVIMSGDMAQAQPVLSKNEFKIYTQNYPSLFPFYSGS